MPAFLTSQRPLRRWLLDLSAVLVLLASALVGFWPTFGGPSFLVAALGGILLGMAIAIVCTWRRWGILIVAGLTVIAYFLFGSALALPHEAIARVVPTPTTLGELAVGAVTSWKLLLTSVAPVSAADGHLLVPYLVALLSGVAAASFALRLRTAFWALAPVLGAFALVVALGVPQPAFPIAQGIVLAIVTALWMSLRSWWVPQVGVVDISEVDPTRAAHMRTRRLIGGVAVLAVAAGAGLGASALTDPNAPRHVFRDAVIPPFNVHDYASPLQSFRKLVRDDKKKLFTITGLPKDSRVRLAAMDQWDGNVFNVTDGGQGSSSAFSPLRSDMAGDTQGVPTRMTVKIDAYAGVWVPGVREVDDLYFEGARGDTLRRSAYSNTATQTSVVTAGLKKGDEYTIESIIAPPPSDEQLSGVPFANVKVAASPDAPPTLAAMASDAITEAESPIEQARSLERFFAEGGYFSHGLDGDPVESRAGHTAERLSTLLQGEQMVGDDEQYAALMALAAHEVGIPARVVMGFYPDEGHAGQKTYTVRSGDVHAWVEIPFEGLGWVAFDPTPPEDKVPKNQNTKPKVNPKPQVLQPPPPPQEPVDLPPTVPDDREAEEDAPDVLGIIGLILAIGGISLLVLLILSSPFIVIGGWKAAKRRRRRTAARLADRVSGGWDELTDRAIDYGARIEPGGTRIEEAVAVGSVLEAPTATALANRADGQVFGPTEPTDQDVEAFWKEIDQAVGGMGAQVGFFRRIRARLNLRSLTGSGRMAARLQELKDAAASRRRPEPGNIDKSTTPESENR